MKFFLDTADVEEIREGVDLGVIDGVTTNPQPDRPPGQGLSEGFGGSVRDLQGARER